MTACGECLRRAWLLSALGQSFERLRHDPGRLEAALALADEDLIQALDGNDASGLREPYAAFDPARTPPRRDVQRICRHDQGFPRGLGEHASSPRLLHVARGRRTLAELLDGPAVAIVGSRRASDYGLETAYGLARGLAAAGITVLGGLAEGVAASAHTGALAAGGPTLTVMPGGLDACYPAAHRELYARLRAEGGALAELPCAAPVRRWCHAARARIVARLAAVIVVVEARDRPGELLEATLAREAGRTIAAVPGRVSAVLADGPHALLAGGAQLVRCPEDVLDLLGRGASHETAALPAPLQGLLELIGAGADTPARLRRRGAGEELLEQLAELEARGALVRGDGGRYVPSARLRCG